MQQYWVILVWSASIFLTSQTGAQVDYSTDVVPILRDHCAGCHNNADLEAEFSVETFKAILRGGESNKEMIIPGKPDQSYLLQVITGASKPKMPPKREPQLNDTQKRTLTQWVQQGARGPEEGEDHSILKSVMLPKIPVSPDQKPLITATAISEDDRWLARAGFGVLTLQSLPDESIRWSTEQIPGKVGAVHLNHGKVIVASGVTGLLGEASIWNLDNGNLIRKFSKGHTDLLYDAELSPDGNLLATAGYDRTIRIWNIETGEEIQSIEGHYGAIFDLAFHPDGGLLASASADETIKIWRIEDGVRIDTLNQPQGEQFQVTFTRDGQHILGAGADRRIRMWGMADSMQPVIHPLIHTRFAHEGKIVQLLLENNDSWIASASADQSIKFWSLPDLNPLSIWGEEPDMLVSMAARTATNELLVHRMDGSAQWRNLGDQKKKPSSDIHQNVVLTPSSNGDANLTIAEPTSIQSRQDNHSWMSAQQIEAPSLVSGVLAQPQAEAYFKFTGKKGQQWVVEVDAARSGSPLDSFIEILDVKGKPILQVQLQAIRDSWFTFRGKDSTTSGDFRLQNWREMELNEYLYANGEVTRLWLYPRGPDSGFLVYPGFGNRHTYFGTTPITHALGEPCYIVYPLHPGAQPSPNGLPVFQVFYENDDDPYRRLGKDSKVIFKVPEDGEYIIRIKDVRGFGGDAFKYKLALRSRQPGFSVRVEGWKEKISPGSGREFILKVDRHDDFRGPIQVDATHVPDGFHVSTPILIQAEQHMAVGTVYLERSDNVRSLTGGNISFSASANVDGQIAMHQVESVGKVSVGEDAKVLVEVLPLKDELTNGAPLELVIAPGETISARVRIQRNGFDQRVPFGNEDAGRNLPHGLFVDNIGLNGLMIVEGQTERVFYITAAKWAPETTRSFHLRTTADNAQCSAPVTLHVRRTAQSADQRASR